MKRMLLVVLVLAVTLPALCQTTEKERKEKQLKAIEMEYKKAVDEGQMTKKQAAEKMAIIKKKMYSAQSEKKELEIYMKGASVALKQAVENGSMSEKEAKAVLEKMHKNTKVGVPYQVDDELKRKMEKELVLIRSAVESGKITPDEGKKRSEEIRKKVAHYQKQKAVQANVDSYLKAVRLELDKALEAGQITKAEARKKMAKAEKQAQDKRKILEKKIKEEDGLKHP